MACARSTRLGRQLCPSPDANTCTDKHCIWPGTPDVCWPRPGLDQSVVRTCHTRMNCPEQREAGLQHRTPSMDPPSLKDELLHCTSNSQKAGSATLGAKVPSNQDGETAAFSPHLASGKQPHGRFELEGRDHQACTHPEDKLFSVQLSLLFTPPTSPC